MTGEPRTAGDTHAATPSRVTRFGEAELDADPAELRIAGQRAPLGRRGLRLLSFLIEHRHRPLSKQELLESVWQGLVVEENNLQVQISTLRRLLGAQSIATVPGRGYRFMLEVATDPAPAMPHADEASTRPSFKGNLSGRQAALYGREQDARAVADSVEAHALVTLVGAAGIGKTCLAFAVAQQLAHRFAGGVWAIELATLNDPRLLVQTFARAIQMELPALREPLQELCAGLRGQSTLLVVDNCEHMVEAVADLVRRLLAEVDSLQVIATSQEPLRLAQEHEYRLSPLSVPADAKAADAGSYGAVRLFLERSKARLPAFESSRPSLESIVDICRRLDGLPLAIELAAARVPMLGVEGVRERLGARFRVLTGGSRFAPKRHQTLHAALDWSHAMLGEDERAVFRRLGVFVGSFSLEGAQDVASSEGIDEWQVLEHLGSLTEKSLVIIEGQDRPRYRMLESTREYALEQLAAAGETDAWIERHANATRRTLERAIRQRRDDAVLAEMPNVRAAFEWARGQPEQAPLSVALATLPAMVIAIEGGVLEARQRLLSVEAILDARTSPQLSAKYWQWVGRIGLNGRLPASRCIEAFRRAEAIYMHLGKPRHIHACRRHLAEALLDAGDLPGAHAALELARTMEDAEWPSVDRLRRLRVKGLWLARGGRIQEGLRASSQALAMAQEQGVVRYQLVLLDDIARMHLEAGQADEAAAQYRALADRAGDSGGAGLTLSNALSGLIAALTAQGRLDAAEQVAAQALPVMLRSGILLARADILALLMARRGRHLLAARLLGASERFRQQCETGRDPVEQHCHASACAGLAACIEPQELAECMAQGGLMREDELARSLAASMQASGAPAASPRAEGAPA